MTKHQTRQRTILCNVEVPKGAITATAHNLARIVFHLLKHRQYFNPLTPQAYYEQLRQRELKYRKHRAAKLGLTLQAQPSGC